MLLRCAVISSAKYDSSKVTWSHDDNHRNLYTAELGANRADYGNSL